MSRNTASIQVNRKEPSSLMESFGAVQAALSAMPDSAFEKSSTSMADAFLQTDPVLSSLDKQRLEANQHYNTLVRTYGFDDAMVEAASLQRAAVEEAYNMRLAALRRKRTEGRSARASNDDELSLQGKNRAVAAQDHQRQLKREEERLLQEALKQQKSKKSNDTLWLWALIIFSLLNRADYQRRQTLRFA